MDAPPADSESWSSQSIQSGSAGGCGHVWRSGGGVRHPAASPVMPPSLRDPQVARALRLIREHPDEPWTVIRLAAAVSLSRSAFASRFHDATGEAPMRYLTNYRLSRAATYLRTTDAGLREIARLTGYESEVSLSKAFRRRHGCSPGDYRRAPAGPA